MEVMGLMLGEFVDE
jgi:26S proteasome regulatory subunit N11